ncbi:MAG: hypothetical protein JXA21_00560 [Anaerolineae bacterium]|nr:hypothetical protein [Anaerolineae bacterium]
MSLIKTDQEWQAEVEQLKADHAMDITLLRTQLQSSQMRLATCARARQRTEAALQQYLEALYPDLFVQALGARMSVVEAGEYFYTHYLYGSDPAKLFGPSEALQRAEVAQALRTPPPVIVEQGVDLSGDAVKLLYALGSTVVADEARQLWAQHAGKAVGTAKNTVFPELLDKGMMQVEQIAVPRYLTCYASDTCYVLTNAGQAEYRRRFNSEPITYEAAYGPYKSAEAWWMIRATKAMIQAGNALPGNHRFTYTVYDPVRDLDEMNAADFTPRYGHSEPDLVVVVLPRSGGDPQWLAIECERGNYNSTRLKQKLLKNLEDYALAGFSGCYYIANNRDTARVLGGTITRIRDGLRERPDTISTPGFLALFTLESLRETWLPTPRFILTEFFDRKIQRPNPEWPQDAARPERYFKYTPVDKGQDAGGKTQEAGSKGQETRSKRQEAGSKGQDADSEWPGEGDALLDVEEEVPNVENDEEEGEE